MAQKWRKNGIWGHFSIFSPFLGPVFPHFGPRAIFFFLGQFFPIFGFRPVFHSIPGGLTRKKSLQKSLPAPVSKKCPRQSQKSLRSLKTVFFETPDSSETVSDTFWTPGPETLRGFRAQRARETPVRGGWDPNSWTHRGCFSRGISSAMRALQSDRQAPFILVMTSSPNLNVYCSFLIGGSLDSKTLKCWAPSFSLENTKSPNPQNSENYSKITIWPTLGLS